MLEEEGWHSEARGHPPPVNDDSEYPPQSTLTRRTQTSSFYVDFIQESPLQTDVVSQHNTMISHTHKSSTCTVNTQDIVNLVEEHSEQSK